MPFFGFIIGPYFKESPSHMPPAACISNSLPPPILTSCFHVHCNKSKKLPFAVPFEVAPAASITTDICKSLERLKKL